jgi:hypothetical protein
VSSFWHEVLCRLAAVQIVEMNAPVARINCGRVWAWGVISYWTWGVISYHSRFARPGDRRIVASTPLDRGSLSVEELDALMQCGNPDAILLSFDEHGCTRS